MVAHNCTITVPALGETEWWAGENSLGHMVRWRKGRGRMWGEEGGLTSGCLRDWESNKGVKGRTGADALALNPGLPLLGFVLMGGINS